MWSYVKRLEYPVNIKNPNPAAAKVILDALGGPDGELGAANRYLSQRFTMPYNEVVGILTDIGTEELGHVEMVSSIIYQLTRNLSVEEIKKAGLTHISLSIRREYILAHRPGSRSAHSALR